MTTENTFIIECRANAQVDQLFLALCCKHKNLAAKSFETDDQNPSLKWANNHIIGAAAVCLFLEASIAEPSLFPNGNIGMPVALLHWRQSVATIPARNITAILANGLLISRQLEDGRPFLQGPLPGLTDICAASWSIPHKHLFGNDHILMRWIERMQTIAAPQPEQLTPNLTREEELSHSGQYMGLLNFHLSGNTTTITSPLDSTHRP